MALPSLATFSLLSALLFGTLLSLQLLPHAASQALLLPLAHTHAQTTSTQPLLHLLKSSTLRSSARFRSHRQHRRPHRFQRRQVSLPLAPGSDYTLSLSLGPSTTVDLYMDTGSDLVWFPCAPFECILCEGKPKPSSPPPPPPRASSLIHCAHPACSAAHSSLPSSDLCTMARCPLDDLETDSCPSSYSCPPLYYAYGDGSLVARLRQGHLMLPTAPHVKLTNFTFGCAHTALGEPVGVAGFGRGLLSLPTQLAELSPGLGGQFSYCLVYHSFQSHRLLRPSPLILGRSTTVDSPDTAEPFVYTPMLHNPKHPYFYLVSLEAISVGGKRIKAEPSLVSVDKEGNGGMVVDSGTTFTMLPANTHGRVAEEFDRAMQAQKFVRAAEVEADTGLAPCYYYNKDTQRNESRKVPSLELHFFGSASVALPRRNYFLGFQRDGKGVGCLMVMSIGGGDEEEDAGGPAGTLGNFQQQGMEVVYDLDGRRVGFARRRCAALWDSLPRG